MNQSILYSSFILGIPVMYWLLMVASHLIHIYFKVESDVQTNKVAIKAYFTDPWKITSFIVAFCQSAILLIAGWDAYIKYADKHPDIDLSLYIGVAVCAIGYAGSSIWGNLMDMVKKGIDKKFSNDSSD
jgi:hypothetical protein